MDVGVGIESRSDTQGSSNMVNTGMLQDKHGRLTCESESQKW